jgi:hypothetical protein
VVGGGTGTLTVGGWWWHLNGRLLHTDGGWQHSDTLRQHPYDWQWHLDGQRQHLNERRWHPDSNNTWQSGGTMLSRPYQAAAFSFIQRGFVPDSDMSIGRISHPLVVSNQDSGANHQDALISKPRELQKACRRCLRLRASMT